MRVPSLPGCGRRRGPRHTASDASGISCDCITISVIRLLLIEDDAMIGERVGKALRQEGFTADWLRNDKSAETTLDGSIHNLVLRAGQLLLC